VRLPHQELAHLNVLSQLLEVGGTSPRLRESLWRSDRLGRRQEAGRIDRLKWATLRVNVGKVSN